ncbi:hypothetical protein OIU74_024626 [Salix koriyanagi]|uniref:Uncharacterized protein n=1 Tax=Salix koriyanagi TaxID=2511006 RepID=A0A9Q0W8B5_9ROSI|nr:hypothetical protein OIU74_024626 [Salix koriyanagi]
MLIDLDKIFTYIYKPPPVDSPPTRETSNSWIKDGSYALTLTLDFTRWFSRVDYISWIVLPDGAYSALVKLIHGSSASLLAKYLHIKLRSSAAAFYCHGLPYLQITARFSSSVNIAMLWSFFTAKQSVLVDSLALQHFLLSSHQLQHLALKTPAATPLMSSHAQMQTILTRICASRIEKKPRNRKADQSSEILAPFESVCGRRTLHQATWLPYKPLSCVNASGASWKVLRSFSLKLDLPTSCSDRSTILKLLHLAPLWME